MTQLFFISFYKDFEDLMNKSNSLINNEITGDLSATDTLDQVRNMLTNYKLNTINLDSEQTQECLSKNETLLFQVDKVDE